jgi:hypothetical protein
MSVNRDEIQLAYFILDILTQRHVVTIKYVQNWRRLLQAVWNGVDDHVGQYNTSLLLCLVSIGMLHHVFKVVDIAQLAWDSDTLFVEINIKLRLPDSHISYTTLMLCVRSLPYIAMASFASCTLCIYNNRAQMTVPVRPFPALQCTTTLF